MKSSDYNRDSEDLTPPVRPPTGGKRFIKREDDSTDTSDKEDQKPLLSQ